jgi:glycosyltransferase involved in cell wall biosynthesis
MIYIILPCYNEQEVLATTNKQLISLMAEIPLETRILYVDDGSADSTWSIIQSLQQENPRVVRGVRLAHNVGHQSALWAGMEACVEDAEAIITIDADLQDDIHVIPRMVQDYMQGIDVVYGVRKERKTDMFLKRWTAQGFYRVMSLMGCDTVYNHADFRLLSQRAAKALLSYPERNLYIRGIVPLLGFQTKKEYYCQKARTLGVTKYPMSKMLALAFEGITSFTTKPLHWVLLAGLMFILISFCVIAYAIYTRMTGRTVEGWTSLLVSVWFVGGSLLLAVGIIGEYIGKVYRETKQRPRYFVMEDTKDDSVECNSSISIPNINCLLRKRTDNYVVAENS